MDIEGADGPSASRGLPPSQHGSVPPMRDSFSSPQPEDTGALSPLRADRGGVATHQSPPPCGFSTAAQESSLSFPLVQLDPPRPRLADGPSAPSLSKLQALSRPASPHPRGRLSPQVRGPLIPPKPTRVLQALLRTIPPHVSRSSSSSWTPGQHWGHLKQAFHRSG